MKENVIDKNYIILVLLSLGLFIPSFINAILDLGSYKQIIIGSIINTSLFLSNVYIKDNKKIFVLSTLPSISNILTGILFTGLTFYSSLMIPFIWMGNLALVYLLRVFKSKTKYLFASFISILIKVSIIYGGFLIVSNAFNYPIKVVNLMGTSMGIIQIYTACIGLVISTIILKIKSND